MMTSPSLNQASYYLLYHKNKKEGQQSSCFSCSSLSEQEQQILIDRQQKASCSTTTSSNLLAPAVGVVPHENQEEEEQTTTFWEDFEWTLQERDKAKEILQENFIKSSIHSNHIRGRSKFVVDQLDKEAHCHWDQFYTCHQTNFFKDRHYLSKAFPEEFGILYSSFKETTQQQQQEQQQQQQQQQEHQSIDFNHDDDMVDDDFTIVEIGCGVGNTLLPLLELEPFVTINKCSSDDNNNNNNNNNGIQKRRISIWGLDFSQVAIQLLQQDTRYIQAQKQKRAMSAVWDITKSSPREIHPSLQSCSNISLLLFCLSAISPDKMPQAAKNVADTLRPGGTLLIRDYGRYDEAQLKLARSRGKCISENFYVKHDSTRVYYFELDDLERLFGGGGGTSSSSSSPSKSNHGAGLICIEKKYIQRVYRNRSNGTERRRVWVQARYRKPARPGQDHDIIL